MSTSLRFGAPWGKLLVGLTTLGTVVIGGALAMMVFAPRVPSSMRLALGGVLTGTLAYCAATAVRGYRLEGDVLIIERLGWDKHVPLAGLRAVRHDTKLLDGAMRVGNGGLFVFSGWFWSKAIGWFHLAGNDILGRAVLLELPDVKWVVTPDDPRAFVAAAEKLIGT